MTGSEGAREVNSSLSHHPAPQRGRAHPLALAFATMAAPAAWFLQLTINYALFAQSCFNATERIRDLPVAEHWTRPAALVVYAVCLLAGVVASMMAWDLFRRTRSEHAGHAGDIEEAGSGRTRFLAYWGILLGVSFTTVTAVNLLPLLSLPPCVL